MHGLRAFVALTLALASGCFTVQTSSERRYNIVPQPGHMQYTANSVSGVRPKLTFEGGRHKLELYAVGDFTVHAGRMDVKVDKGVPSVTFGMFPGTRAEKCSDGMTAFNVFFARLTLFTLPTVYALLIEPFRDYHAERGFEAVALLGFCKHFTGAGEVPNGGDFVETRRYKAGTVQLFGYDVIVNGRRHEAGSTGCVYLTGLSRGSVVRMRIVTAPSLRQDSADKISDLVGLEVEARCP